MSRKLDYSVTPGYEDAVVTVIVEPSGFVTTTDDFSVGATESDVPIVTYAARLNPDTLTYAEAQEILGGLPSVSITVTNDNVLAGVITTNPVFAQT